MCFGHSFTWQQCFGGLKMQTFENDFKMLVFEKDVIISANYENANLWKRLHAQTHYVFSLYEYMYAQAK